ncbi:tetratricopeptide repeat protein [Phycisphaerales bacterium AB-hyl4]|uniref:Tetratricopeptide repeat protein n=1 Tax=Natronomicrosphaera hydrolytica TaxID=3242702 RepID=A0ABV4U1Z0_9BACT
MNRIVFRHKFALAAAVLLLPVVLMSTGCETQSMIREKGEVAYYGGNYAQARAEYARAVDNQPSDYRAHYHLGLSYLELDQPGRAQRSFEQALTLRGRDPEWRPRILDGLAEALYRQDRLERLQAMLEDAVREGNTTHDRLRQADYLMKIGDPDGARNAYRTAAYFAEGRDPRPYVAVADFYEQINDEMNAVRALRWAYYVDHGNPEIAERLRGYGIVPGPTVAEAPPKPEMLR